MTLPLYLILNLSSHIGAIYIANFFLGVALMGRFACSFILLTESVPKENQALVGAAFAVGDVIVTLYITFLLRYATQNTSTLIWIGFAINCVSVVLSFWIVESP